MSDFVLPKYEELREKANSLRAEKQELSNKYNGGMMMSNQEVGLLSTIMANSLEPEKDANRFAMAMLYNKNAGIDLGYAYQHIDSLNDGTLGIRQGDYTPSALRAINDSFTISMLNLEKSDLGLKFHDMEVKGLDTTEIAKKIDALDEEMYSLQDRMPRSWLTNVFKFVASSVPYTASVGASGAIAGATSGALAGLIAGTALSATGAGSVIGIPLMATSANTILTVSMLAMNGASMAGSWKRSVDIAKGAMYYDLRKKGVEQNIAEWVSSANGWVQGSVEIFLGMTPSALKAMTRTLGKEAATAVTAKAVSKMYVGGWLDKLALLGKRHIMDAGGEAAEEVVQSLAENGFNYVASVLTENGYTFDKSASDVLKEALYEGGAGFVSAFIMGIPFSAINTKAELDYARHLKGEAQISSSKEDFIEKHKDDAAFSELSDKDKADTLGEIYDRNNKGLFSEVAEDILDTDVLPETNEAEEGLSEEPDEEYKAEKLGRKENGRLRVQESKNRQTIDGKDRRTLNIGTPGTKQRFGRIIFDIGDDNTIEIQKVLTKAGYAEDVTYDAVLEIARRYQGYDINWSPENKFQQSVKERLIRDNSVQEGKIQRFIGGRTTANKIATEYINDAANKYLSPEQRKRFGRAEAGVASILVEDIAEAMGRTVHSIKDDTIMFQDKETGKMAGGIRFEGAEEMLGRNAATGGVSPDTIKAMLQGGVAVVYVGKKGNASTFIHELDHILNIADPKSSAKIAQELKKSAADGSLKEYIKDYFTFYKKTMRMNDKDVTVDDIVNEISTMSDNPLEWTARQSEAVTATFERYLTEGRTFSPELNNIFDKIAEWFRRIYRWMKQGKYLNDNIVKAFDEMLTRNPEMKAKFDADTEIQNNEMMYKSEVEEADQEEADRQYNEVVAKYKDTDQWLKAPNGQPTKLTERQWVQVRTPAFKAWFGDWENDTDNASKVVDENGEPKVVYHGTGADFDTFGEYAEYDDRTFWFAENEAYSDEYTSYSGDNPHIIGTFLNIKNPANYREGEDIIYGYPVIDKNAIGEEGYANQGEIDRLAETLGLTAEEVLDKYDGFTEWQVVGTKEFADAMTEKGFDGIMLLEDGEPTWGAFSPEQIKSATDNVGTFSQSNPSILFQTAQQADFQQRMIAAQDFRDEAKDYGHRVKINWDGSITLYHGTSKENADSIQTNGINAQSYFGYSQKEAEYYAKKKHKDGVVIKVNVDPRDIEFAAAGAELYTPNELKFRNGMYTSQPDTSHSNLLFQSAYHGSGANFDKFDTAFMGTGEGAQAFGWGIYLTQSKGIAENYAEQMRNRAKGEIPTRYKGKDIKEVLPSNTVGEINDDMVKGVAVFYLRLAEANTYQDNIFPEARDTVQKQMDNHKEDVTYLRNSIDILGKRINDPRFNQESVKKFLDDAERRLPEAETQVELYEGVLKLLENPKDWKLLKRAKSSVKRNLYTVSIPDDTGSNYLYWDRQLTKEQMNAIAETLEAEKTEAKAQDIDEFIKGMTGEWNATGDEIYRTLQYTIFGSDEKTSKFLNRAGFVGIDYPANSLSGGNKYGKRNFVIFNADDITIDNHLMWQPDFEADARQWLVNSAKDMSLDEYISLYEDENFSDVDRQFLTDIWSEANGVQRTRRGFHIDTAGMGDDDKDKAFEAVIDTDEGVQNIVATAREIYSTIRNFIKAQNGVLDDDDVALLSDVYTKANIFESTASKYFVNIAKGTEELTDTAIKQLRTTMKNELSVYRDLMENISENEDYSADADFEPDIADPVGEGVQVMDDAERKNDASQITDEKLKKGIITGTEKFEGRAEELAEELDKDIESLQDRATDVETALNKEKERYSKKFSKADQKKLSQAEKYQDYIGQYDKLSKSIQQSQDARMEVPQSKYEKLNKLNSTIKEIENGIVELRKLMNIDAYLKKTEALRKLKADIREKQRQKRLAKEMHEYKVKLYNYLMKEPGKNVNYQEAQKIIEIIATIAGAYGYDNDITYKDKKYTSKEFREAVNSGAINRDELSIYQKKRVDNKSLSDYSIEELEKYARDKRELTKQGREAWQTKVDNRNYIASVVREAIDSQLRKSPDYTNAPLPETKEEKQKNATVGQKIFNAFISSLRTDSLARMLDGNKKGEAYKVLIEEARDLRTKELAAVRERVRPIVNLMEKYGVKMGDFYYDTYTLNIGGVDATYNVSQLIYGKKAQLNERNKNAFMFGSLMSLEEKEDIKRQARNISQDPKQQRAWANKRATEIGEERNRQFLMQAEKILDGLNPGIMKVADAISQDWNNEKNRNRLNDAMIEEYNEGIIMEENYMPIKRMDFNGEDLASRLADELYNRNAGKGLTSVESGMTKSRIDIAPIDQQRVDTDFMGLWFNSVKEQEHLINFNSYIRKLNRIFKGRNSKGLRADINAVYGKKIMTDVDSYINELANPQSFQGDKDADKYVRFLRGKLYEAYLGMKLSSFILQVITSPAPFLREVNPVQLADKIMKVVLHPHETWKQITDLSPMMEDRIMNPMAEDIEKERKDYTLSKGKRNFNEVTSWLTGLLNVADRWMVSAGWLACYEKQYEIELKKGVDVKQAEQNAAKYADTVVYETQPMAYKAEQASMFRQGGAAWQLLTQFQVSLNVIWNNLAYDTVYTAWKNKKLTKQQMYTVLGYALAGIILYEAQEGFEGGDDDKEKGKRAIYKLLYSAASQGLSSVPLAGGSIESAVKNMASGEKTYYSRKLYPAFSTTLEGVGDAVANGINWKNIKKTAEGIGLFTGIPVSGIKEFNHAIRDKNGRYRFYPGAFLGRREKTKKKK